MKTELVPLARIVPDPRNPRTDFTPERREQLIASIRLHGLKCPLIGYVAGNQVRLIDGHCRFEAAKSLSLAEVPVVLFSEPPTEGDVLCAQLTINGHRTALNPVDEFEAFSRLAKLWNWSPSELAAGLAVSAAEVTRVLSIGKLTPEERQLVRQGKLSKSAAYALSRVPEEQRSGILGRIGEGEITRDQLQATTQRRKSADAVKSQRIQCAIPGGMVSVQSIERINLNDFIELLEGVVRDCKKANKQGLDLDTAMRVFRDRCRVASQPQS